MKKFLKQSLAVFLAVIIVVGVVPLSGLVGFDLLGLKKSFYIESQATQTKYKEGYYTYTIDESGMATITKCEKHASGDVIIPSQINGIIVKSIGVQAFYECSKITSVVIPNSITEIGSNAFRRCTNLENIQIGDSVEKLGVAAFYDTSYYDNSANWESGLLYINNFLIGNDDNIEICNIKEGTKIISASFFSCKKLTKVIIPSSVVCIEEFEDVFYACDNLVEIVVDSRNKNYSSDDYGVLFNKNKSVLIKYPEGNSRTVYQIPEGVKSIGENAFNSCEYIVNIIIPQSVEGIGAYAFNYCYSLGNINVNKNNINYSNDEYGVLFNKTKTTLIQYPIGNERNSYCLPNSVNIISNHAFAGCTNLTEVVVSKKLKSIGDNAFSGCKNLNKFTIPNDSQLENIGTGVFWFCRKLTEFIVPNSVTEIGYDAFSNCDRLIYLHIPSKVNLIGEPNLQNSNPYICSNSDDCYAKEFAEANGYEFRLCDGSHAIEGGEESPDASRMEFSQIHTVSNYQSKNDGYTTEYFDGEGYPLDGSNGTSDMCIPGLSKEDDMVPQGITYYSKNNQILVSAYSSDGCETENRPSVIYALDYDTGDYVAEYKIYNSNGTSHTGHVGGIAVSEQNLYITTNNCTISYIPLSELNAPKGASKDIYIVDSYSVPGMLDGASTSYLSYSDGHLWTGNFYYIIKYKKPASRSNNSLVLGFALNGTDSTSEWNALKHKSAADYTFKIPNSISKIQGAAVSLSDKKMILMSSYGRTSLSTMYTINIADDNITSTDIQSTTGIPMLEGAFIYDNYVYTVTESASWFYNGYNPKKLSKDPTDVIWKIKISDEISDETSISKTINYSIKGVSGSVDVAFRDSWFSKDNKIYNHDLARFCADYAMMGYCYDENDIKDYLSHMGFDNVDSEMNTGRDEVNYFITSKKITVNGEIKTLVFAGFIGSHNEQWYSNFDPNGWQRENKYAGNSEKGYVHLGFADAREYVYKKLKNYISVNNIEKDNMKLLLCGHSRGAAAANLLAAKLVDEHYNDPSTAMVSYKDLYTYTFATPNTASTERNVFADKYKCIFNVVNPEDFVTKVMLNDWGFYRYGKTFILPSKTNDHNYKTYLNNMRPLFKLYCGKTYDPYTMGEVKTTNIIKSISENVSTLDELYTDSYTYSVSIDDGIEKQPPFNFFKRTLLKYLVDDDKDEILRIFSTCSLFYKNIIQYFAWPDANANNVLEIGGKFTQAHQMETYAAYMNSLTSTQLKQTRFYYENIVNCPVDIEVYDNATNELVGKITNNIVDETIAAKENAIAMDVEGDSKSFYLPSNGDYRVVLTGNNEGKMDYTVSDINSDMGETERINFFDVKIENGVSMDGEIAAEEFVLEEYTLTTENGNVIKYDDIITSENTVNYECDVAVSIEGSGTVSGNGTYIKGDNVTLSAVSSEYSEFIGWFNGNNLISVEQTYSFVVKKSQHFTAKFKTVFDIISPSTTTISYGDKIVLHAFVSDTIPDGWCVEWIASNSNFNIEVSSDSTTCTISPNKSGDTTFTATVYDASGKVISEDTQEMTSKAGFFQKIIAFFKKLFGLTKTIPQIYKDIF